jgi:signal transduction histidine kinase
MATRSLGDRLLLISTVWIAGALLVAGLVLSNLFRQQVERDLAHDLQILLDTLLFVTDVGPDGSITLSRRLSDPEFEQPFSGRYWEILVDDKPVLRSASLEDRQLPLTPMQRDGGLAQSVVNGPRGEKLLLVDLDLHLPASEHRYRYAIAADLAEVNPDLVRADRILIGILVVLGLFLIGAVFTQVRLGLRPLGRLGAEIARIRAGHQDRLSGTFPVEVAPLAEEVNALIDHNNVVVERARTHIGNLAHALKTPISVLTARAGSEPSQLAEVVRQQARAMYRHVEHHLTRAQSAGHSGPVGRRTEVRATIEDMRRTLAQIYAERGLDIRIDSAPELVFMGERQDLEEMLGNLLDNACKWARRQVQLTARAEGNRLVLAVEDDGPGLPAAFPAEAFERGTRLDEAVPGTGFGLAIVRDIAAMYGGRIQLGRSPLGGLAARLELPRAARAAAV